MAEKREQRGIQGVAGGKSSAPVQWRVARRAGEKTGISDGGNWRLWFC